MSERIARSSLQLGIVGRLRLDSGDITNANFQGKPLERLLLLRAWKCPKGVPDPEVSAAGAMLARVPIYGANLRLLDITKQSGFRRSLIFSVLYYALNED